MKPTPIIDMFSDNYGPARTYLHKRFPEVEVCKDFRGQIVPKGSNADSPRSTTKGPSDGFFTLKRVKPEALEVGDIIYIDPYELEITHIRAYTTDQGETEYILSTVHYFFVWSVESVIRVRADNRLLLKKRI